MLHKRWKLLLMVAGLVAMVSCALAGQITSSQLSAGTWYAVDPSLPYYFENAGADQLTISFDRTVSTFAVTVHGKARLLPVGTIYTDQQFDLAIDEGSIARAVDTAGKLDWGSLPKQEISKAELNLEFCRCVAQFESGKPVTENKLLSGNIDYKFIEGEPARLLFMGHPGGSCGAFDSDLRFQLIGKDNIELYQLRPSGRFRVFGTVRVKQTNQACKNGWIDKSGKVIASEQVSDEQQLPDQQESKPAHFPGVVREYPNKVESLIKAGENVNTRDGDGSTALHYAVNDNNVDMVKLLLDNGANPNIKETVGWGWYPLHYALRNENKEIVKLLIERGADVNAQRTDGWYALHTAAYHGQSDVIEFMVSKGAKVNVFNRERSTPLRLAINEHKIEAAKVLIGHGADLNAPTDDGQTPLHHAAQEGITSEAWLLIANKANINALDKNHETPLHFAVRAGDVSMVKLMISKGAGINAQDSKGETPLYKATYRGYVDIVTLLISKGANVNLPAQGNVTPLQAAKNGEKAFMGGNIKEFQGGSVNDWGRVRKILLKHKAK